jgi:PAS domain S-box-containing protein
MEMHSLAEVEALYGSLVETLPAIVYVAEPTPPYVTIFISRGIELLGFTRDEWLARPDSWVQILHEEDREWVLGQTQQAMAQGKENDYEYRVIARDGSVRWLHDRGRFVCNELGKLICWQGILLDVTRRKQMEAERESLVQQLSSALADVKTLSGLVPICSYCKKVRTDANYWQTIEAYITQHSTAKFSHGICPDCWAGIVQRQLPGP